MEARLGPAALGRRGARRRRLRGRRAGLRPAHDRVRSAPAPRARQRARRGSLWPRSQALRTAPEHGRAAERRDVRAGPLLVLDRHGPEARIQPVFSAFAGSPAGLERLGVERGPERWLASIEGLRGDLELSRAGRSCRPGPTTPGCAARTPPRRRANSRISARGRWARSPSRASTPGAPAQRSWRERSGAAGAPPARSALHPARRVSYCAWTRTDLGRIVAFTDGVMAVAITLLVLNIEVPDVGGRTRRRARSTSFRALASYAFSFALVGRFWVDPPQRVRAPARLRRHADGAQPVFLSRSRWCRSPPICTRSTTTSRSQRPCSAPRSAGRVRPLGMTCHALRRSCSRRAPREAAAFGSPVALGFRRSSCLRAAGLHQPPPRAAALWISTIVLRYPLRRLARPRQLP